MFAIVPRNRSQGRQPTQAQERALRSENPHAASPHEPGNPPCQGVRFGASLSPCAASSRPALDSSPPAGSMAWLPAPSGFWKLRPMHLRRRRLPSFASRIPPGGVSAGPRPPGTLSCSFGAVLPFPAAAQPNRPPSGHSPAVSLHVPTSGPRFPSFPLRGSFFLLRSATFAPCQRPAPEKEKRTPWGGTCC